MSKRKILHFIFIIMLFLFSVPFNVSGNTSASLSINIIATILSMLFIIDTNKILTSLIVIFYAFSGLYGLSGPISVIWGEGLATIFGSNYSVGVFLVTYAISNIGLLSGFILFFLANDVHKKDAKKNIMHVVNNDELFLDFSILLMLLSFIFETINFIRVGGFPVLMAGKAAYQSGLSEMTLTLPSESVTRIGVALLSLYLANKNYKKLQVNKSMILLFLFLSTPYTLINLFLGKRGSLLSIVIVFIMGISFVKPIKKIKPRLIIFGVIFYVLMAFLYANRGIAFTIFHDLDYFMDRAFEKSRLINALNPGAQEFGAPFGNFNTFYNKTEGDFTLLLGFSYIRGLVLPIPSFLYPGAKPQQIGYIFRDIFFPMEAARGSIAGTAFSSILEAYWNFGFLGILVVYFLIGYLLVYLDNIFKYKSKITLILYLLIAPIMVTFHRTSMSNIYANIVMSLANLLIFVYLPLKVMRGSGVSILKKSHN